MFNDLWLDEIWSINLVSQLTTPSQILTELKHDNNHPLNSLFIFLVRGVGADWTYRLLSWCTGVATVWMAGLVGRRLYECLHPGAAGEWRNRAGLLTAAVFAASYIQIQYSSEARGYAPAVFFGMVALYAMLRGATTASSRWIAAYWSGCILGMLSHAVFIPIQLGGIALSAHIAWRRTTSWPKRFAHLVDWNLVPSAALVGYDLLFLQWLVVGGGNEYSLASVFAETAAFALGLPSWLGVPSLCVVAIVGVTLIARADAGIAIFFAIGLMAAPLAGTLNPSGLLYPRYLLVSVALLQVIGGYLLARGLAVGQRTAVAVAVVVLVLFIGGTFYTVRLSQNGRGQYRLALLKILNTGSAEPIAVSSDHDFRNATVISHHARALAAENRIVYYATERLPPGGVSWFFRHEFADNPELAAETMTIAGAVYRLSVITRHAPPSGWNWYLYKRDE